MRRVPRPQLFVVYEYYFWLAKRSLASAPVYGSRETLVGGGCTCQQVVAVVCRLAACFRCAWTLPSPLDAASSSGKNDGPVVIAVSFGQRSKNRRIINK